jgi:AcrR family transcriptional regulator
LEVRTQLNITSNYNESPTKKNKREIILTIAYKLFIEKGIENVSMLEIAEQAGMQRRSLYNYYNDKDQLAIDIYKCQYISALTLNWDLSKKTSYESVEHILTQTYNYTVNDPEFIVFSSYFDHYFRKGYGDSDFAQFIDSFHSRLIFSDLKEKWSLDHSINPSYAESLDENIYLTISSIHALAQKIIFNQTKVTDETSYDFSTIKNYVDLMLKLIKA